MGSIDSNTRVAGLPPPCGRSQGYDKSQTIGDFCGAIPTSHLMGVPFRAVAAAKVAESDSNGRSIGPVTQLQGQLRRLGGNGAVKFTEDTAPD